MTQTIDIMAKQESITYPVRFKKTLYDALMQDCKTEHRSLAALMAMLGEEYLKKKGINIEKD